MAEIAQRNSMVGGTRVAGKVAFVTGAAGGIGRATAILLAQHGADVVVGDLVEEEGSKVVDAIRSAGGAATFARVDVTSEDQVRQTMDGIAKKWGKLDVLVNNAGIAGIQKPIHEVTTAE